DRTNGARHGTLVPPHEFPIGRRAGAVGDSPRTTRGHRRWQEESEGGGRSGQAGSRPDHRPLLPRRAGAGATEPPGRARTMITSLCPLGEGTANPMSTESLQKLVTELDVLIRARYPLVAANTHEENRFRRVMHAVANLKTHKEKDKGLYLWSRTMGLR